VAASFSLQGQDAVIKIDAFRYENPRAHDPHDADWILCKLSIKAGPFSAEYDTSLTARDFSEFRGLLEVAWSSLSGKATFSTPEGTLEFTISFQRGGQATVHGTCRNAGISRARMEFEFQTDQTFIREALSDLGRVTAAFPRRA
jgi:hypothetical protein